MLTLINKYTGHSDVVLSTTAYQIDIALYFFYLNPFYDGGDTIKNYYNID